MKSLKFMLTACVAAVALTSCEKESFEPQVQDTRMKSVEVSLENVAFSATRGAAGSKITNGQAVVVNDFKIFLTDDAGNEYPAKVADGSADSKTYWSAEDLSSGNLPTEADFHYVDHGCVKIVAVANLGEDMTYSEFLQMGNLKIENEQNQTDLSLYAEDYLTLSKEQHSDANVDNTVYASDVYKAELTLTPRISRFEVDGFSVKFNPTPTHQEIQITDLLFQHYDSETSLRTGTEAGSHIKHIADLNNQTEVYNWFNKTYSEVWDWDHFATPLVIRAADAVSNVAATDTPAPLAYHAFAGTTIPTMVIKLVVDGQPAYLYSKGFYSSEKMENGSPAPITTFEEGKIYRMSAAGEVLGDGSIPIDEDDIDPMDRCLEITVDVVDWVVELVYPEF